MRVIKNIIKLKKIIDSNHGIYSGWEVLYNSKIIAELNYTYTMFNNQHLYQIKKMNIELISPEDLKEIFQYKAKYRSKYFNSKEYLPIVDFLAIYYESTSLLGCEYLSVSDKEKIIRNNVFYKIIFFFLEIYDLFKKRKLILDSKYCSELSSDYENYLRQYPSWSERL